MSNATLPTAADVAAIRRRRATRLPFHDAAQIAKAMRHRAALERMVANPFN
jgi:hypothetical protein